MNHPSAIQGVIMAFKIERRVLENAPNIKKGDVMTMAEAAQMLGVSHSAVNNLMIRQRLTTVVDTGNRTAYLRLRRLVLRSEVEKLKAELQLGEQ